MLRGFSPFTDIKSCVWFIFHGLLHWNIQSVRLNRATLLNRVNRACQKKNFVVFRFGFVFLNVLMNTTSCVNFIKISSVWLILCVTKGQIFTQN